MLFLNDVKMHVSMQVGLLLEDSVISAKQMFLMLIIQI